MTVVVWIVVLAFAVFTARRYLYWAASLAPRGPDPMARGKSVAILVAARNEAERLPGLLAALEALDYPQSLLSFVLVSDGSTDATPQILQAWASRRAGATAIVSPGHRGKAAALQEGLAITRGADLVAVLDADTLPRPDAIARLVGAFENPRVGGAGGYPDPGFDHAAMVSRYAALERWAFHLVTLAGKDRLGLQPDIIGAICCFRADALAEVGGFPQGGAAEDILLSRALSQAGWKTRWIRAAVAREDVPIALAEFRLQRLRWSRGLLASSAKARGVEDVLVAAGYADRLVFVAGVVLVLAGRMPWWLLVAYAAAPVAVVLTALQRSGARGKFDYLASIAPMAFVDVTVTLESVVAQIAGAPVRWGLKPRARKSQL